MASSLDRGKTKPLTPLEMVENMRAWTYPAAVDWGHFVIRDTKRKTTKVWRVPA